MTQATRHGSDAKKVGDGWAEINTCREHDGICFSTLGMELSRSLWNSAYAVWTHSHRFKEQKGKKIITQVTHEPSFSVYSVTMLNSSYIHVPLLVRRP